MLKVLERIGAQQQRKRGQDATAYYRLIHRLAAGKIPKEDEEELARIMGEQDISAEQVERDLDTVRKAAKLQRYIDEVNAQEPQIKEALARGEKQGKTGLQEREAFFKKQGQITADYLRATGRLSGRAEAKRDLRELHRAHPQIFAGEVRA